MNGWGYDSSRKQWSMAFYGTRELHELTREDKRFFINGLTSYISTQTNNVITKLMDYSHLERPPYSFQVEDAQRMLENKKMFMLS